MAVRGVRQVTGCTLSHFRHLQALGAGEGGGRMASAASIGILGSSCSRARAEDSRVARFEDDGRDSGHRSGAAVIADIWAADSVIGHQSVAVTQQSNWAADRSSR